MAAGMPQQVLVSAPRQLSRQVHQHLPRSTTSFFGPANHFDVTSARSLRKGTEPFLWSWHSTFPSTQLCTTQQYVPRRTVVPESPNGADKQQHRGSHDGLAQPAAQFFFQGFCEFWRLALFYSNSKEVYYEDVFIQILL